MVNEKLLRISLSTAGSLTLDSNAIIMPATAAAQMNEYLRMHKSGSGESTHTKYTTGAENGKLNSRFINFNELSQQQSAPVVNLYVRRPAGASNGNGSNIGLHTRLVI